MTDKVAIRRLQTGVPGLDGLLGGGLPEFAQLLLEVIGTRMAAQRA